MRTQGPARTHAPRVLSAVLLTLAAVWLSGCGGGLSNDLTQADTKTASGLSADPSATSVKLPREAEALTAAGTPGSNAYKIGPQDTIEITVFKVPELSRTVQVADSGTVNLPLVGDVVAAGKTSQQLERDLVKKYGGKYLQSPQVTVSVREYNSQRVTIEGAVKKPGVYPIRGKATLLQFIATAEGLDPNADSTVVIFRTTNGKKSAAKFDIAAIRSGGTPDPVIQSGDMIIASNSAIKETFNTILKALPIAGVFAML
jgi:polysaccharide export outer membrane protein